MTAAEALRRYHAAEMRLAEVEALISQIDAWKTDDRKRRWTSYTSHPLDAPCPNPDETLQSLYLERERLQAESFRVYMEARRAS